MGIPKGYKFPRTDNSIPDRIIDNSIKSKLDNKYVQYPFVLQQLQGRLVRLNDVNGNKRYGEPYQIYLSRRNKVLLHFYQYGGYSKSGVTKGWKNIPIEEIKSVDISVKKKFKNGVRKEYNPHNTYMFRQLYFQIPTQDRKLPTRLVDFFDVYTFGNKGKFDISKKWLNYINEKILGNKKDKELVSNPETGQKIIEKKQQIENIITMIEQNLKKRKSRPITKKSIGQLNFEKYLTKKIK